MAACLIWSTSWHVIDSLLRPLTFTLRLFVPTVHDLSLRRDDITFRQHRLLLRRYDITFCLHYRTFIGNTFRHPCLQNRHGISIQWSGWRTLLLTWSCIDVKIIDANNNCYYWLIQTFITPIICYVLLQIDLPFRNWKRAPLNIWHSIWSDRGCSGDFAQSFFVYFYFLLLFCFVFFSRDGHVVQRR